MIVRRLSPLLRTTSSSSRCSSSRTVSSTSPVIPITAFIGVRISWLIIARNEDFARVASRAASRACAISSVARRACVTSTLTPQIA